MDLRSLLLSFLRYSSVAKRGKSGINNLFYRYLELTDPFLLPPKLRPRGPKRKRRRRLETLQPGTLRMIRHSRCRPLIPSTPRTSARIRPVPKRRRRAMTIPWRMLSLDIQLPNLAIYNQLMPVRPNVILSSSPTNWRKKITCPPRNVALPMLGEASLEQNSLITVAILSFVSVSKSYCYLLMY